MCAYNDLKNIMEKILTLERSLNDFYDVAEIAMRDKKSKDMIKLLQEKHLDNLKILQDIKVEDFGFDEWVKYAPDFHEKEIIPIGKIKRESSPDEICKYILECEGKTKAFYASIAQKIIDRNERELFDSLVAFKEMQIMQITKLVDYIEYL